MQKKKKETLPKLLLFNFRLIIASFIQNSSLFFAKFRGIDWIQNTKNAKYQRPYFEPTCWIIANCPHSPFSR